MFDKPALFFRRRERGATVFRILDGPNGRMEMVQIAVLKPDGDIKSANKQSPSAEETAEITRWHKARKARQAARDAVRLDTLVGDINAASHWLQSGATEEQVQDYSRDILLALHDLRATIVKRLSKAGNATNSKKE